MSIFSFAFGKRELSRRRIASSLLVKSLSVLVASFAFTLAGAVPSFVSEKAVMWFDAADASTLMLDDSGCVTNWVSRDTRHDTPLSATVPDGYLAPKYDTENFGISTVDFGALKSKHDMTFPRQNDIRTLFMVVKIAKSGDAFLLGDVSTYYFHRGTGGAYGNPAYFRCQRLWDREVPVDDWRTAVIPDDSFRVIAMKTTGNCPVSSFTQDRTYSQIPDRNG